MIENLLGYLNLSRITMSSRLWKMTRWSNTIGNSDQSLDRFYSSGGHGNDAGIGRYKKIINDGRVLAGEIDLFANTSILLIFNFDLSTRFIQFFVAS